MSDEAVCRTAPATPGLLKTQMIFGFFILKLILTNMIVTKEVVTM